jgi:hypothetical protein
VLTRNFFAHLRTNDTGTETVGAENTVPAKEAPRKSGRPPPIVMTSTINLIRLQNDLKEHVKGEYESEIHEMYVTRIITKVMADYSAMKSYLEKNNSTILPSPQIQKSLSRHTSHREANDGHTKSTQRTNPRGTPPSIPYYLNK